jgi:hypothetical protein
MFRKFFPFLHAHLTTLAVREKMPLHRRSAPAAVAASYHYVCYDM